VVDALKEAGLYDDTLIIFLSDHGDFAGDYSLPEKTHATLQDCLIRVPFIIKPPADYGVRPGVRQHLTELVDMTATIYDLLGIDPGYDSFGKSLRESLRGSDDEIHPAVFAEVGSRKQEAAFLNLEVKDLPADSFYGVQSRQTWSYALEGCYAVTARTHKYKYVRRGYDDYHELYDLTVDPGELNNLSGKPQYADVERQMETLLLNHFMTTGDVMPRKQDSRK
jgi:arylsulfatase A-like enzyme